MQLLSFLALSGLVVATAARTSRSATYAKRNLQPPRPRFGYPSQPNSHTKRAAETIITQTNKTASKAS